MDADVSPRELPADEYAPVRWSVFGKIGTTDGGHPPALREVEFNIDKDVRINVKGYPVCRGGQRGYRGSTDIPKACRDAVIGKGEAHVEIAFPEEEPILVQSPLTVFNGGEKGGEVKLLIRAVIALPKPTAIVATISLRKRGTGVEAAAWIPVIAGGSGSVIDFKFKVGKTYTYKGKKVGYAEAKCPDGVFKANVKKILFKNEVHSAGEGASTQLKGALAVPCTSAS